MKKIIILVGIFILTVGISVPVFGLELEKNNIPKVLLPDNFSISLEEKNEKFISKKIKKAKNIVHVKGQKHQKKAGKKSKKAKYHNGNLSENIVINEIFPHAKKDDRHSEWIELYNNGKADINLGNWQLDDKEKGSRPYIFPDTINIRAGEFLVITAQQSKISLGNEQDQVRLFDYRGKEISRVEYEQAAAGKVYARTIVAKEDGKKVVKWFFDEQNTAGKTNPELLEISGIIVNEPVWENPYTFAFLTSKNEQRNIIFQENLIQGPLAKATFVKGVRAKLLVAKAQNKPDGFELKQYEILDSPKRIKEDKNILRTIFITGILIIGAIILAVVESFKFYGKLKRGTL